MGEFRRRVGEVLVMHREGRPVADCPDCTGDWPRYRAHVAELIAQERARADQTENRQLADFPRILAEHAPYASHNARGVQCLACLDGHGQGEFASTDEWAQHVTEAVAEARMKVVRGA